MNYYLGIDLGTTAVKAGIFTADGNAAGIGLSEYALETPAPDVVELEPEVYYQATVAAVEAAFGEARIERTAVKAAAITGQAETLICLDKTGRPLRKAIVWLDNRAVAEAAELTREFSAEAMFRLSGQTEVLPYFPGPKIRWLATHEPEVFRRTAKFLMVEDYIVYRLTGEFASCGGLWPSSCFYDLRTHRWAQPVLDFLKIAPDRLPALHGPGTVLARCAPDQQLLAPGTPLAGAPIDHATGALGAGCAEEGCVSETIGCTLALCAPHDGLLYDEGRRISTYEGFAPGQSVLLPWAPAAGMLLRSFRDHFAGNLAYADLDRLAEAIPPGSEGLLLLPHCAGAVSPEVNPAARGAAYGITLAHRPGHWARAIMESVAFLLRDNLDVLRASGCAVTSLRALGGASRSRLWRQILADVLQLPIALPESVETTALGAAMLGAVSAGEFADCMAATRAMTRCADTVRPDPDHAAVYDRIFHQYRHLNALLLPTFGGNL